MQIAAFSKAFITTYSIITLQFHCFPRIFRRIPSRTKNQFGAPQADLPTLRPGFGSPSSCQSLPKGLNSQEFYEDLMVMATSSGMKDATIMEVSNL